MDTNLLLAVGIGVFLLVAIVIVWQQSRGSGIIQTPVIGASAPGISPIPEAPPELTDEMLVPIENEMVQRSTEQAIKRGDPIRRYVVQRQGKLFFTFEAMPDPEQRQRAYRIFRGVNTGQDVDIREVVEFVRLMSKE